MKLPKFLAVGLLGTITNLTLFYIFVDIMMFPATDISPFNSISGARIVPNEFDLLFD